MENYSLDMLNDEQRIPVLDTEGAVLVTAGAGSGKTRMLTHRIAHLISDKGISPYNILAITFTNKAASEMKERLGKMLPDSRGLWVSTFHSMCVTLLRMFCDCLGFSSSFSIYTEVEKERIIKRLLKERKTEDDDGLSKRISTAISCAKNEGYSPDEYAVINKFMQDIEIISDVYDCYEKELKNSNSLDFDDLLLYAHKMLKESQSARDYCHKRFKYIHVDEFQDTNTIQYKLLIQLASNHKNVFVVGDEDQSIYGWRGANIENIRNFVKHFDARVYKLEQNYRSTKAILLAANTLIANNSSRIDKKLWTENEDGIDINYYAATRDSVEADFVLNTLMSLRGKGYRYSDMAILMRVNALTRGFEQRLLAYNIPYKVFGGFRFFERKEVKDILGYARMIANPSDNEAITRVINFPKRGIGDTAVQQLINYAALSQHSLFDIILNIQRNDDLPSSLITKIKPFSKVINELVEKKDNLKPHEFLAYIVETIGLKELYKEPNEENENRIMHIGELIESASEFSSQNTEADISDYLQMVTLYSDTEEIDESRDYVSLATVHSAKGLEFGVVFIVGMEEGLFPLSRATEGADLEEERRLMYVAITRAKKRLYITRSRSRFLYGRAKDAPPSRFLSECGLVSEEAESSPSGNRYTDEAGRTHRQSGRVAHTQKSITVSYKKEEKRVENTENSGLYREGMAVMHKRFGRGKILSIDNTGNSYAVIEFATGKMTLALNYAPLQIVD